MPAGLLHYKQTADNVASTLGEETLGQRVERAGSKAKAGKRMGAERMRGATRDERKAGLEGRNRLRASGDRGLPGGHSAL